jgi:hypothetical protein
MAGDEGRMVRAFAMYRLLIDQRNFPEGLRGYPLYLLQKEGVFTNTVSRQYKNVQVTEGGNFGVGREWKLTTLELTEVQKAALDLLHRDMIEFVGETR